MHPSSMELTLSDSFCSSSDMGYGLDQSVFVPSVANPGLLLSFHGKIDIISIKWTFQCCQMIPDVGATFIEQYIIIPLVSINEIMRDRETKILEMLNAHKEQVRLIEQLYKVELKRDVVKILDIDFNQDQFVEWKDVDWRKRIEVARSTDGFPQSQNLLEKMNIFVREKQAMEEKELEELKRKQEIKSAQTISLAPVSTSTVAAPSGADKIEQERLRRLKREADLAKAKEKQTKRAKKIF